MTVYTVVISILMVVHFWTWLSRSGFNGWYIIFEPLCYGSWSCSLSMWLIFHNLKIICILRWVVWCPFILITMSPKVIAAAVVLQTSNVHRQELCSLYSPIIPSHDAAIRRWCIPEFHFRRCVRTRMKLMICVQNCIIYLSIAQLVSVVCIDYKWT